MAAGCAQRGVGVDFVCDVILNRRLEIVEVFAGELFVMHRAAVGRARELSMRPVPQRYDVVVTSNAAFPLDQNLYQTVKGDGGRGGGGPARGSNHRGRRVP